MHCSDIANFELTLLLIPTQSYSLVQITQHQCRPVPPVENSCSNGGRQENDAAGLGWRALMMVLEPFCVTHSLVIAGKILRAIRKR
jgi:hypothetical protein